MARMRAYHVSGGTLVWKTFGDLGRGPGIVVDHETSAGELNPDLLVVLWPTGKMTSEHMTSIQLHEPYVYKIPKHA